MNLKRKDLAKQFEDIVKQEIINFNNTVNEIRQSIQDVKNQLEEDSKKKDQEIAKLKSFCSDAKNEILNIYACHKRIYDVINENEGSKQKKLSDLEYHVNLLKNGKFNLNTIRSDFRERVDDICQLLHKVDERLGNLKKVDDQNRAYLERKIEHVVKKAKDEILNMPNEAREVREELGEELACYKLDVEGILKELRIVKKANFINEKKIEYICNEAGIRLK